MRLRLIHIILSLLLTATLFAQPKLLKEEFYLGVQGGPTASMMFFNPVVGQKALDPHLSWNAGLVFRYIGHRVCGLQAEVNYLNRGWKEQHTSYERSMDYVQAALLSHIYFGKKARGYLNLGPEIGYLIREQYKFSDPNDDRPKWGFEDGKNSLVVHQYARTEKPFDWGLMAALGFYYRSKVAGSYQLEARFCYSLGNVFADSQMDYFANSNHMNLSINLAYMWEFK